MKTRTCVRCRREREVGAQIGSRGIAVCRTCKLKPKVPRYKRVTRDCRRCGRRCKIGSEIAPMGRFCFGCQTDAARKRKHDRYLKRKAEPGYDEQRLHELELRRAARARRKSEDPEWFEHEREYARQYRETHRAQQREYVRRYEEKVRRNPILRTQQLEKGRERARKYRAKPEIRERYQEQSRARHAALRSDPQAWEAHLEDQRMHYRLRAEREGRPLRPVTERSYAKRRGPYAKGENFVPAAPLAPLIEEWLGEDHGRQIHNGHPFAGGVITTAGLSTLAELAGVDQRRIYSALHVEYETIHRDIADQILSAIGIPFRMVYPS